MTVQETFDKWYGELLKRSSVSCAEIKKDIEDAFFAGHSTGRIQCQEELKPQISDLYRERQLVKIEAEKWKAEAEHKQIKDMDVKEFDKWLVEYLEKVEDKYGWAQLDSRVVDMLKDAFWSGYHHTEQNQQLGKILQYHIDASDKWCIKSREAEKEVEKLKKLNCQVIADNEGLKMLLKQLKAAAELTADYHKNLHALIQDCLNKSDYVTCFIEFSSGVAGATPGEETVATVICSLCKYRQVALGKSICEGCYKEWSKIHSH